ncbi:HAD family hydrolase [Georgenia soli]|uniref:HAD family hydrolase n=1 Tax=Georgenia soli TaxID=638953 RepID=UPI0014738C5A|nr:HAD family hydrolase [Georgenia soli]
MATDIDGTIVPHGGTVSARTRDALAECVRTGLHVTLVTGRPPRWMPPILDATGFRGTMICANGAIVIDAATDEVVTVHRLPVPTVHRVVERLRERLSDVLFAIETPYSLRVESGYRNVRGRGRGRGRGRAEGLAPRSVAPESEAPRVEDLLDDEPIIKMVAISASLTPDELLVIGRDAVGDLVAPTHSSTGLALLELGPLGVSKASTLAALADSLAVDRSEVIAFGDMPNDVEMLTWAGSGYAMEGGHPAAVAAATHLAPPAGEDGVAQVLEDHLRAGGRISELSRMAAQD